MPLLVLLPIAGFILGWRRFFGGRTSSAALHAVAAIILFLYAAAYVGLLRQMTFVVLAWGVLLLIYHCYLVIREGESTADDLPLAILVLLSALTWWIHKDGFFLFYDEYSHWGIFLREMLYLDGFWTADTSAIHSRYPPAATLWQYLFLEFTDHRDGVAYLAQFVLLMTPLIVFWQNLSWRQLPWILGIVALLAFGLANFGHGIASLYVDHILGAWFAGLILNFLCDLRSRQPAELVTYVLPLSALVLLKGAGLFLALICASLFAILLLVGLYRTESAEGSGFGRRSALALAAIWLLVPIVVAASWTWNRDSAGAEREIYSTSQLVSGLFRGDSILDADQEDELAQRFSTVITDQQLSKNAALRSYDEFSFPIMDIFTDRFRLTTLSFLVIWIIWQILVLQWSVQPADRLMWSITALGVLLGSILYIGLLYLSYRFAFGENGLRLPSYLRYVHTVTLPLLLIGAAPLIPAFRGQTERIERLQGLRTAHPASLLFLFALAALYVLETPHLRPFYRANGELAFRHLTAPLAERVQSIVGASRIWVYLPIQDPNGLLDMVMRFQLSPARVEVEADAHYFAGDQLELPDAWRDQDYLWFPLEHPEIDAKIATHVSGGMGQRLIRVTPTGDGLLIVPLTGSDQ